MSNQLSIDNLNAEAMIATLEILNKELSKANADYIKMQAAVATLSPKVAQLEQQVMLLVAQSRNSGPTSGV